MRRLLLITSCAALAACATTTPPAATTGAPPAAPPASAAQSADRSLDPLGYARLGFPAVDRVWAASDFTAVNDVLATLAKEDPLKLPRRGSPRSGVVFRHMTDRASFASLGDRTMTARVRAGMALAGMVGVGGVLQTYVNPQLAGKAAFGPELVDLLGITVHASRRCLEVVLELESPPSGDPGRKAYDEGLVKMRGGLAQIVTGALQSMAEPYATADRLRLAGWLVEELPSCLPLLSEQSQAEMRAKIRRAADTEKDAGVKARLVQLQRAAKA